MSYLSGMDDIDMTCSDFVNLIKMLTCSEKHPVSGANHGYTEKVVIDRWPTMRDFISSAILLQILIYSMIF